MVLVSIVTLPVVEKRGSECSTVSVAGSCTLSFSPCRGCSEGCVAASGRGFSLADGPGFKGPPVTAVRGMLGKPKHLGIQNGRMVSEDTSAATGGWQARGHNCRHWRTRVFLLPLCSSHWRLGRSLAQRDAHLLVFSLAEPLGQVHVSGCLSLLWGDYRD